MGIEETKLMITLNGKNSALYHQILNVYNEIESLLNQRIYQTFRTYTQHDSNHSIRIMEHMYYIVEDVKKLNALEISLLIYSALLHDIGMSVTDEEEKKIKNDEITYRNIKYSVFKNSYDNEIEAFQEYIRKVHAKRSGDYIISNLKNKLIIPEMQEVSFCQILSEICEAHNESFDWMENRFENNVIYGDYSINPKFLAVVLRLGDILDFDSNRTPKKLYESIIQNDFGEDEWQQHFKIINSNKIVVDEKKGIKTIEFHGTCSNPITYRKIQKYIDWVKVELDYALDSCDDSDSKYYFNFNNKVVNSIKKDGFSIVDLKFQMDYQKIMDLLMGEHLYNDKRMGLRELIQNSIDACKLYNEILHSNDEDDEYVPKIQIIVNENENKVVIKDNGTGMDIYRIKNYLLKIGSSYYKSDDYKYSNYDYEPIGNYGIGFLSSFMLSNDITVKTRLHTDEKINIVDINKYDDYVSIQQDKNVNFRGTEISLNYGSFFKVFKDIQDIKDFVSENFILDKINLIIKDEKNNEKINLKTIEEYTDEDFSNYLDKVHLGIKFTNNLKFRKFISDIDDYQNDYVYDGEKVTLVRDSKLYIKDFVDEYNNINIVSFAVIEDSNDLNDVLEKENEGYIDDAEEFYRDNYNDEDIYIIVPPQYVKNFKNGYSNSPQIVKDLYYENLEGIGEYGHDDASGTFYSLSTLPFYTIDGFDMYIELHRFSSIPDINVYVRNVFVENLKFNIPSFLHDVTFEKVVINISNPKILPNTSRNKLSKNDETIIRKTIIGAMLAYLNKALEIPTEKLLFENYINSIDLNGGLIKSLEFSK